MEGQPIFTIEAQQQSDAYVMRCGAGGLDQGACGGCSRSLWARPSWRRRAESSSNTTQFR